MDDIESTVVNQPTGGDKMASNDVYALANSDHPGSKLVSNLFNDGNFLSWSLAVRNALGSKNKLQFIDGTLVIPGKKTPEYGRWLRADYMVRCWVVNSMDGSLGDGFMYVKSARQLWEEVVERYGDSSSPLVFQLRRSLNSLSQDNLSVAEYYGNMKKILDEIQGLDDIPECVCEGCTCNFQKKIRERDSSNTVMQFLIGLNDGFESVRDHILTMDPIPSLNRAFHLVQQVERQKTIVGSSQLGQDSSALAANRPRGTWLSKDEYRKSKMERVCSHCKQRAHTVDQCFKLLGYPDWFKELKDKKSGSTMANVADFMESPLDVGKPEGGPSDVDANLASRVVQEVLRALKGKGLADGPSNNFAYNNFAGP